jgi:hypothetical protein
VAGRRGGAGVRLAVAAAGVPWYVLPRKFLTDTARHQRIAGDLEQAFDLVGMPFGLGGGGKAFRRARERSGVAATESA